MQVQPAHAGLGEALSLTIDALSNNINEIDQETAEVVLGAMLSWETYLAPLVVQAIRAGANVEVG